MTGPCLGMLATALGNASVFGAAMLYALADIALTLLFTRHQRSRRADRPCFVFGGVSECITGLSSWTSGVLCWLWVRRKR